MGARRQGSVTPTKSRERPQARIMKQSELVDPDASFRVCARIRPLLDRERTHTPTYSRKSNSIIQTYGPQNKNLLRVYDSDLMYDHLGVRDR